MQIQDIIRCVEERAPLTYQESYDNAGLITGDPGWEVTGVLTTLDATEEVVKEAMEKKCNLVLAHHPILFRSLKKLSGGGYVERAIITAVKHDIAIYAAHTNLDNVTRGVNDMIAERLGLVHTAILEPRPGTLKKLYTFTPTEDAARVRQALFDAGAGHIGLYGDASFNTPGTGTFRAGEGANPYVGDIGTRHMEPEVRTEVIFPRHLQSAVVRALLAAHPYEEVAYDIVSLDNPNQEIGSGLIGELPEPMEETPFLRHLKDRMQTDCIRHSPLRGVPVRRVAVCGGAGSFLTARAIGAGAQVYVSADFKYHEFFDADGQIVIADTGHFESEQFTPEIFCRLIRERFSNFAPLKSSVRTNPINYLH
jgi:dinuclear metal center YbgI/SA1388 family protein